MNKDELDRQEALAYQTAYMDQFRSMSGPAEVSRAVVSCVAAYIGYAFLLGGMEQVETVATMIEQLLDEARSELYARKDKKNV